MSDSGEVVVPEVQQPVAEAPQAEVKPEENEKPVKEKKPKKMTEKKPKHHKLAAHPPYFQMIKDAITALKEKNGSSPYAIAKHIESEHSADLPVNFRKILSLQLKNSTARGKLMKIKASYKLCEERAATTRSVRANAVKPGETVTKRRRSSRSKSVNQMQMEVTEKARKMRKSAPATKPKQPKSIKSGVKKTKKLTAV